MIVKNRILKLVLLSLVLVLLVFQSTKAQAELDFGFEAEMLKLIRKMDLDNMIKVVTNPPRQDVIAAYKSSPEQFSEP